MTPPLPRFSAPLALCCLLAPAALCLPAAPCLPAAQAPPRVLHSTLAGHPTSAIPGLPGVRFTRLVFLEGSPCGRWAMIADGDQDTQSQNTLVLDGQAVLSLGDPVPGAPPGEEVRFISAMDLDSAGNLAVCCISSVASGSLASVLHLGPGGWTSLVRRGDPTGIAAFPGSTWGFLDDPVIDDGGRVGWYGAVLHPSLGGSENQVFFLDGEILVRTGAPLPGAAPGTENVRSLRLESFHVAEDGSHWSAGLLLDAGLDEDDVFLVDGDILFRAGDPSPAGGVMERFAWAVHSQGGSWLLWGFDVGDPRTWLVRDGVLESAPGGPVEPGGSEQWTIRFLAAGSWGGRSLLVGHTDHPDPARDQVLVVDDERVVLREGDPLDLDGNGLLDDDLFVAAITEEAVLTDAGTVLVIVSVRDTGGVVLGRALVRLSLDPGNVGQNHCGALPGSTGLPAWMSGQGSASVSANDLVLRANPVPAQQPGIFFYGPEETLLPFGPGLRCVGPGSAGLFRLPPSASSAAGVLEWSVDLTQPPQLAGRITAGSTWSFQAWFRDPGAGGFQLSDGLSISFGP